jgi:ABC-2 type transport system ATP-binding protein
MTLTTGAATNTSTGRNADGDRMIQVSNLCRYYGHFPAVDDLSFSVENGEIIGILGLNGAGKSTTLKVLAGLLPPSSGTVMIDGTNINDAPADFQARIGYLPEDPPLYMEMTVAGSLTHMGRLKQMSAAKVAERLPSVLEVTQLTERKDQVIGTLSHGFRKRVGIAQAIIHDPQLVILDEPISGLDPVQIVDMRDVIRRLGEGRVVMVSSHILSEISQTCDRILVLQDGKLIAMGTEDELSSQVDQTKVVLTVRGEAEPFQAWLNAQNIVQTATPQHSVPGTTSAMVQLTGDHREQLVTECIAAGFGIRQLGPAHDELEDIFLGLTRGASA